jgi:hypothetical protein
MRSLKTRVTDQVPAEHLNRASTTWHQCRITGTVVNSYGIYLVLQESYGQTFDGRSWTRVPDACAKPLLATALTAVSMGFPVLVEYDGLQVVTLVVQATT